MESQRLYEDWTGNVVKDATMRSLDLEAVRVARAIFSSAFGDREQECAEWDDEMFLTRAGLLKRGRITVSAMILLGKVSECDFPKNVRIRWRLYDTEGRLEDTRVFDEPMVLAISHAASTVRNSSVKIPGSNPRYVSAYRIKTLEEALVNAVAHQDYSIGGTVDMIERDRESVTVFNRGGFGDGHPEMFITSHPSAVKRRNPFLCKAISGLGMAPMNATGIRGMYLSQAFRHYPMPRFSMSDDSFSVTFPGIRSGPLVRIMDSREDLDIDSVVDLDRISRGLYVPDSRMSLLERRGLVDLTDGIPCLVCDNSSSHIRLFKGSDSDAVLDFIRENGAVRRSDVVAILSARVVKDKTPEQLAIKATNLLQTMRKEGLIEKAEGNTRSASYIMVDRGE